MLAIKFIFNFVHNVFCLFFFLANKGTTECWESVTTALKIQPSSFIPFIPALTDCHSSL